jgi:hypothetical protein
LILSYPPHFVFLCLPLLAQTCESIFTYLLIHIVMSEDTERYP